MRTWWGVTGVVVLVGLAGLWFVRQPSAPAAAGDAQAPASAELTVAPTAPPSTVATPRARMSADIEHQRETDARIKIGDELYQPKSPEDVAWRLRNCYVSMAQRQMADDRINARQPLQTDDLCSPVSIRHAGHMAMISAEQRARALEFLKASAAAGSLSALEELSSVYSFISPQGIHDPVLSEAYARVAIARGDWGSAMFNMRAPLDQGDTIVSEVYAQQILQDLNQRRQRRGLPPLGYDPQPGMPSPDALRDALARERDSSRP